VVICGPIEVIFDVNNKCQNSEFSRHHIYPNFLPFPKLTN